MRTNKSSLYANIKTNVCITHKTLDFDLISLSGNNGKSLFACIYTNMREKERDKSMLVTI